MERKIYFNLAAISTITAIITSILLVFLFYDFYNVNELSYSLGNLFLTILPVMIGLIVFILIFLYIISYFLTSKIIKPIEMASQNIESILSGEDVKEGYIYDELKPFIKTIEFQKMEIKHSISKLKEAEIIRRDFTANVSHELKTPLTSINGFAEMIATGMAKDEDAVKFANIIHKEGIRLLDLIDSIINLSQLEDKTSERIFETIDIYEIAYKIVSQLQFRASEKNVAINIYGESTLIRGNRRMLEDLIYNLVDNGIKYNRYSGKVDIFINKSSDYGLIKVSDTGIGIPLESQNRIFERFFMVDKSRSKKVNGTGLGLSIVKHIVEYHGGNISLTSELDKGTDIDIRMPI